MGRTFVVKGAGNWSEARRKRREWWTSLGGGWGSVEGDEGWNSFFLFSKRLEGARFGKGGFGLLVKAISIQNQKPQFSEVWSGMRGGFWYQVRSIDVCDLTKYFLGWSISLTAQATQTRV